MMSATLQMDVFQQPPRGGDKRDAADTLTSPALEATHPTTQIVYINTFLQINIKISTVKISYRIHHTGLNRKKCDVEDGVPDFLHPPISGCQEAYSFTGGVDV